MWFWTFIMMICPISQQNNMRDILHIVHWHVCDTCENPWRLNPVVHHQLFTIKFWTLNLLWAQPRVFGWPDSRHCYGLSSLSRFCKWMARSIPCKVWIQFQFHCGLASSSWDTCTLHTTMASTEYHLRLLLSLQEQRLQTFQYHAHQQTKIFEGPC